MRLTGKETDALEERLVLSADFKGILISSHLTWPRREAESVMELGAPAEEH